VEQGNHEELLANEGPYHALYHAQFAAAAVDVDVA
jgi:ABC-type multidrug transport system fused ATPase/permease subunit